MPTLGEKYFLRLLRLKHLFSQNRESPLKLPLEIPPVPKILLCFPENEEDLRSIQNHLPSFTRIFVSGTFFIVVKQPFEASFSRDSSIQILPFSQDDFSSGGILKKQWTEQLPKDIFIAIDFNRIESLWSGYLCFASRAPVRISLKKPGVMNFFNIILNPNQEETFEGQLAYLSKIIQDLTQTRKELRINHGTT